MLSSHGLYTKGAIARCCNSRDGGKLIAAGLHVKINTSCDDASCYNCSTYAFQGRADPCRGKTHCTTVLLLKIVILVIN